MVDGANVPVAQTGRDGAAESMPPPGLAAALFGPDQAPVPLAPEDLAILELESPTVAGHTCKVLRVGPRAPDVAALRERIAERIHLAPAFTRRLGEDAAGAPAWVVDPDFDVRDHVVAHHHDDPVSSDGLRRCVARLFEQRLDRGRPLWRMDVIELTDDRHAIVWRIHHALADGTAMLRYARSLLWDGTPESTQTQAQARADHVADDARRRVHLAGYVRRELRRSHGRSPFDGPICSRRDVGFATVPLKSVHDAAKALCGATLNDAVLSIVAGALRHWVIDHHGHLGTIRVKIPVSMHHEGDKVANHDSMFTLGLPLAEADPVARLQTIHVRTQARKEAHDAEARELLLHEIRDVSPRLERFATQLERSPRRFALNISNVPGPRQPVAVLSAPVQVLHSLAEISEHHALRVSVMSLADMLCFGFCADAELVPDAQAIADQIEPETQALLDAATP